MDEYYFLFFLGIIWIFFATIQDIKKREIANWLNYSLIAFALAYRMFYSLIFKDINFFLFGLLGTGIFIGLAYGFYYSKVFAGGDAKLLMGIGALMPFESFKDYIILGAGFLFLLLFIGAVYTIIYSFFIALKDYQTFRKNFNIRRYYYLFIIAGIISIFSFLVIEPFYMAFIFFIILEMLALLYVYIKAVDKCMIKLKAGKELQEGDWIEEDIKIGKYTIKKTVHGLSMEDIKMLKKRNKKIKIKEGIPFAPAFLIAFIFMVFFLLNGGYYQILASFVL